MNSNASNILRFQVDSNGNATANGTITGNGLSTPIGGAFTPWGELFVLSDGNSMLSRFVFDSSHAAVANGTYQIGGPAAAGQGGLQNILIVPGASTSSFGDGGIPDGGVVSDGAAE